MGAVVGGQRIVMASPAMARDAAIQLEFRWIASSSRVGLLTMTKGRTGGKLDSIRLVTGNRARSRIRTGVLWLARPRDGGHNFLVGWPTGCSRRPCTSPCADFIPVLARLELPWR